MIKFQCAGRHGNNLFNYVFARILHEETGLKMQFMNTGTSFENRQFFPNAVDMDGEVREECQYFHDETNADDILEKALAIIRGGKGIFLNGYFQNWKYYWSYRDRIKEWLKTEFRIAVAVKSSDWILHVRREDYLESGSQLSLEYYRKIINEYIPKKAHIFLIGKGIELEIKEKFYDMGVNRSIQFNTSIEDFVFMKSFKNIIMSNSTYAFWASFLSDADVIFAPRPSHGYWSNSQVQKLLIPDFHTIIEDNNANN